MPRWTGDRGVMDGLKYEMHALLPEVESFLGGPLLPYYGASFDEPAEPATLAVWDRRGIDAWRQSATRLRLMSTWRSARPELRSITDHDGTRGDRASVSGVSGRWRNSSSVTARSSPRSTRSTPASPSTRRYPT